MAGSHFVNGEAQIKITNGLALLGVSRDGVHITINEHFSRVDRDTEGGPEGPPADEQVFGYTANIRGELTWFDEAVLGGIRFTAASDGTQPAAGTLVGASNNYHRLLITSPIGGHPWNFPTARLMGAREFNIGTKYTIWRVQWFAYSYNPNVGSTSGRVLYDTDDT